MPDHTSPTSIAPTNPSSERPGAGRTSATARDTDDVLTALRTTLDATDVRLVALDMDGSLLDDDKHIPDGFWDVLDALVGHTRLAHHDIANEEPSPLVKTIHDVALEFLDPWDGSNEKCPAA